MFSSSQRFEKIKHLQKNPENVRNICIIAHVDHGKTTLSDCLLSSNNIISRKLAGKLRFMDTRPDEQERRITMKSSAISLIFPHEQKEYLINLIDSPGHVEFSSEVASALRLCDGALILVDAIEGVSSQTLQVMKKAFEEKVQTILVINKIDRLINELEQTPEEAYKHITIIIDQMNAALSSFISSDLQQATSEFLLQDQEEKPTQEVELAVDEKVIEDLEKKVYFSPEKNNVLFASAVDCWCFDVFTFSKILAEKINANPKKLQKYMWGDYYFDTKKKKIFDKPFHDKAKPMFVQFILESVWKVYEIMKEKDMEKIGKIAKAMKIDLPDNYQDLLNKDSNLALNFFMWKWLPIDEIILKNVVAYLPNPIQGQKLRLPNICKKLFTFEKQSKGYSEEEKLALRQIKEAVENCDNSPDAPIVIYISKMMNIPKENINEHGLGQLNPNQETKFIGFARIFSGTLKRGSEIYVISSRAKDKNEEHALEKTKSETVTAKIDSLYLQMSQYLEGIPEISAGNCFGIGDLENVLYKTATVSSTKICPSFSPITFEAMSLLKVAVSTQDLNDYPKLITGLKKLNKSDPSLEIYYEENGDLILSTCGEVHLERCLTDLQNLYAKVEVKVSEPIVSFKETIITDKLTDVQTQAQKAEKIVYEKPAIDKSERREKKEKVKKQVEGDEESDGEVEIVEDTGKDDEETEARMKKVNLKDLEPKVLYTKNYAKAQLKTGKLNLVDVKKKTNVFEALTPNQKFAIRVRAVSLNYEVAKWLEKKTHRIKKLFSPESKFHEKEGLDDFVNEFNQMLEKNDVDKKLIELINNNLVSFGPRKSGPNLLINKLVDKEDSLFYETRVKMQKLAELEQKNTENTNKESVSESPKKQIKSIHQSGNIARLNSTTVDVLKEAYNFTPEELSNAIASGFDLATAAGPLCEEPMIGVCYIVEDFRYVTDQNNNSQPSEGIKKDQEEEKKSELDFEKANPEEEKSDKTMDSVTSAGTSKTDPYGPIFGQIMSSAKEAFLESFLGGEPRLVEGVYLCHCQVPIDEIGHVYDVLNRRRAAVVEEEMNYSSNLYIIKAHLPVCESFGLYSEIWRKTSGKVNPQLEFDTWRVLEIDPFYVPETEDEKEEFGETGLVHNLAKNLIHKIRKRKGILTEEKLVAGGDKQRTLKKNK